MWVWAIVLGFFAFLTLRIWEAIKVKNPQVPGRFWISFPRAKESCFALLEESQKYGEIFRVRLGFYEAVLLLDPELIVQVMSKHFSEFRNRGLLQPESNQILISGGLLLDRDDVWARKRRLVAACFSPSIVNRMAETVVEKTNLLLGRWKETLPENCSIDVLKEMSKITVDVIAATAFGYDSNRIENDDSKFSEAVNAVLINNLLLNMIPYWWLVPTQKNRALLQAIGFFKEIVSSILQQRRKQTNKPKDLLQSLLDATDPDTGESLTEQQLLNEILTILFAGHETTSTTVTWLLYALSQNPDVEKKLLREIDQVLGQSEVTAENIQKCEYLSMCLDETLRMFSTASLLTREAAEGTQLGGYPIRKGTPIAVHTFVVHHNPRYWKDPEVFDPERFSAENKSKIMPGSYIPFGLGPRICLGKRFALTEAKVIAAKLLQRYTFQLIGNFSWRLLVLSRPEGLKMRLVPRALPSSG